jgi:hypothetical protein
VAGGHAKPINRFLGEGMLEPDQVEGLNKAYTLALRSLDLVDRNDPIVDIVAKKSLRPPRRPAVEIQKRFPKPRLDSLAPWQAMPVDPVENDTLWSSQ